MIKEILILSVILVIIISLSLLVIQRNNFKDKNCVDASAECQVFFSKLGITSRMIYGSKWIDSVRYGHCWLEVELCETIEFESTTLQFKDVSSGYKIDWREK